jgi:PAS domain S-box-containing protein
MNELLNHAPCGFLVFADDGTIAQINATLLEILGYEAEELQNLSVENIFTRSGRSFYQTHFFPLLKMQGKIEEMYLDLHSKDGESIPVLVNAARRQDAEKSFNDCVFVVVRQRNLYEEEILQAKRLAETATRTKDEFLSMVSHELRTPLNAILGWVQILEAGTADEATVKRGIEVIGRNARAQTKLIEDILDYARITSGKLTLEIRQVDLAKVVEAAVEVVKSNADAKKVEIKTDVQTNAFVSGDANRLQQVLWNLLQNAVKFTPENGKIEVKVEQTDSAVKLIVSDTGKGIKEDFLPHVFERFQQADQNKSRRSGGLGLGLTIVRQIVELHSGTVRAESGGEGRGATFIVSLPNAQSG